MRALITGGNGFIGSRLAQTLTQKGWEVDVMDLPLDITQKGAWMLKLNNIDYVFHLAAKLDDYSETPSISEYIDTNVKSIGLLFEVITEKKLYIKKIVFASSQSVYGDSTFFMNEKDVLAPLSMYGATKATAETLLFALGVMYNIRTVALRYSIVLGAGQKYKDADSRILPCFVDMAQKGEIITHENGLQTRDFIHVKDAVDVTIFAAKNLTGIFNVGSGDTTSVMEVAKYIGAHFEAEIQTSGKSRINTARNQVMNINKIKQAGWSPRLTWRDAVDEFIASLPPPVA